MPGRRGPKPKPPKLRLITGSRNTTRHGTEAQIRAKVEAAEQTFGKLKRPGHLSGKAKDAWAKWIAPAVWLDGSREPAAIAFCELWDEFRYAPKMFPAAKHAALRSYMDQLGLTDERNRGDFGKPEADEFFE